MTADSSTVRSGKTVTFTATTDGAPFTVRRWFWVASGNAEEAKTQACGHTEPVCAVPVYEDGTMYAQAVVNGVVEQDGAAVDVLSDTLVVELLTGPREFRPVLDRTFHADVQYWSDAATPRRTDLTQLLVRARWEPSGRPAAGAQATLDVEPVAGSGGHPHSDPPKGTFFKPGEDLHVKRRVRERLVLQRSDAGTGEAVYRTSGISGLEKLVVRVDAEGRSATTEDTVVIRWPHLQPMDRTGETYEFSDQGHTRHGNINHFGQIDFVRRVQLLFQQYFDDAPAPRFTEGDRFVINELSLAWGGLLDAGLTAWRNPHRLHRTGMDMDVRYWNMNATQREIFESACTTIRIRCEAHPSVEDADPNNPRDWHYHLLP